LEACPAAAVEPQPPEHGPGSAVTKCRQGHRPDRDRESAQPLLPLAAILYRALAGVFESRPVGRHYDNTSTPPGVQVLKSRNNRSITAAKRAFNRIYRDSRENELVERAIFTR